MLQEIAGRLPPDVVATIEEAQLVYYSDNRAGIRRVRAGEGFRYERVFRDKSQPKPVEDEKTLARVRSLAIPPAWEDVWICPSVNGHIQATGRDQRGRKQYRYHARWSEIRDEAKFTSLAGFGERLPRLRRRIANDMRRDDLSRQRVIASVVWLLDRAMIRVGNETYARENKSFGLTTLRTRHVKVEGETLRFSFRGKSGKEWKLGLSDRRIARVVKDIQELPGQQLFQYLDGAGEKRAVTSQDVNEYIRREIGEGYTSKHFRTWGASVAAAEMFSGVELPSTKTAQRRMMNETIDRVAALLGNTRSVCRKCYIHPLVMQDWLDGRLAADMEKARAALQGAHAGLQRKEAIFRLWLNKALRRRS